MIQTCQDLLQSFDASLQQHTEKVCGKDSPLRTSIPQRLQSSSEGLSSSTALLIQHYIGEAETIVELIDALSKYDVGDVMGYCPTCADVCREARLGLESTE